MLLDTHTNLMWYPDHLSDEFVQFAWEAKRAKMKLSPDVYFAGSESKHANAFDSRPQQLLDATAEADKVIVFGIKAPFCGINADQELIANFVKQHSDRFIGWCSVDPNDCDCVEQLEHYVNNLGFRGLKCSPIYQNWDPQDPKHLPLFKKAESLGIPVNVHQGTSFVRPGPLKYANPILLEDIAIACPDLRLVIAHMGHPWEVDCVVLIRKHPNLYANVSALHYRPLRHYQAFMTAIEYGVEHKLIFGSDFPSATPAQVIAGQHKVNDVVEGTNFPKVPAETIHNIIYENWKRFLPEYALICLVLLSGWLGLGVARADEPTYEWKMVTTSAPWKGRDGAGILSYRGQLWLLGGWNPSDRQTFPMICTNDVWSSRDGADWSLVKANTFKDPSFNRASDWEGRHTAGYAVYRDKMWIIGGDCNQKHYQNDVWNSTDGKNWTNVNQGITPPWAPRALHYTVVHDDKLWVIGGQTMPGFVLSDDKSKDKNQSIGTTEKFYRDVWNSTDGVHWQEVTPQEPFWSPRGMIGGSAVMNGRIWILGGGTYDTPTTPRRNFFNDVWSSSDGIQWTRHTAQAPWHPRQYHDVAVWDNRLWVMEGYHENGGNRNDVWHSTDGVTWTELPNTPWKPRHAASLIVHNGSLWMIAGNNMQPDVWQLVRK